MPRGLRILRPIVGDRDLTHFGGIFLIQRFCQKLKIRVNLQKMVPVDQNIRYYQPADLILGILYALIVGFPRLRKTKVLRGNGVFQQIVGLETYPHASSFRRFLKRTSPRTIQGITHFHDRFRQTLFHLPQRRTCLLFDFDSSVLTVYGRSIEGAKVGYNPHRRGARSYRPLLCFEAHTREFWHGSLRPGNLSDRMGTVPFLEECLAKIPRYIYRLRLRADAGFYGRDFIDALETAKIGYVIVAHLTTRLQHRVAALRYHRFREGRAAAELDYQPMSWKRPRRFVAIRHRLPEKETDQLSLFRTERYGYQVYVTNLDLRPEEVWHFYRRRAGIELDIRELKESYALGRIPTNSYQANQAYFALLLLAYDIVNWFRRLCLPPQFQTAAVGTIRDEFLVLPARLVKTDNRNVLRLPAGYVSQQTIDQIIARIERIELP
jgi:Transposase DDE domain group 1